MRKTALKNYHNACEGIIKLFVRTYIDDCPSDCIDWYCIGDQIDGVVCIGDNYISVQTMHKALELEATRDEFFAHYYMEVENYSLPEKKRKTIPNLENYIKMTRSTLTENSVKEVKAYLVEKGWNNMAEFLQPTEGGSKCCNKPAVMCSLPDDYWEQRCKLIEKVEDENPCDPDITSGQIEAWNNYHKFIKERGQRQ